MASRRSAAIGRWQPRTRRRSLRPLVEALPRQLQLLQDLVVDRHIGEPFDHDAGAFAHPLAERDSAARHRGAGSKSCGTSFEIVAQGEQQCHQFVGIGSFGLWLGPGHSHEIDCNPGNVTSAPAGAGTTSVTAMVVCPSQEELEAAHCWLDHDRVPWPPGDDRVPPRGPLPPRDVAGWPTATRSAPIGPGRACRLAWSAATSISTSPARAGRRSSPRSAAHRCPGPHVVRRAAPDLRPPELLGRPALLRSDGGQPVR